MIQCILGSMIGSLVALAVLAQSGASTTVPLWAPKGVADDADSFVAFRGIITTPQIATRTARTTIRMVGASEYLVWIDGKLVHDGPPRYAQEFPEYQSFGVDLTGGNHVIAIQVRNDGVTTRILSAVKPYLWCSVTPPNGVDRTTWKCARMPGYLSKAHRISDILGWIDWCDTTHVWRDWQGSSFDDSKWLAPVTVDPGVGRFLEAKTAPVRLNELPLKAIAGGGMTVNYGYERDEPAARFFLDDLDPKGVPAQGVWRRYDLGRVRLGRLMLTLDLPRGAIVEYAMCEELRHGRVAPWITLSGSATCNMDHFVARGGVQEFMPFTPKGGRFLEVHVQSKEPVKFVKETFLERTYFPDPAGSFSSDDPLLNKIWMTGVNTVRSCSEDSFVDCPTRERGQWTGDVASVASDIAAVAWSDMRLARRALVQAAQAARGDGLVAGVGPGDPGYLSTYAAQWATACVHYWELTGDKSLLEEMLPAARKNMDAFEAKRAASGVSDSLGWAFVDWGYVRNEGPTDMALNMHYLMAVRSMVRWERAVGDSAKADEDVQIARELERLVTNWLESQIAMPGQWKNVGYQAASLALLTDLVQKDQVQPCIARMKAHLMSCFPNNPDGPRLSDPSVSNEHVMTPYFGHFAFTALLNHGEIDFVLGQYRKCWGWALGDDRTTWLEVFDTRWSHCHEWSGCPTWQLSRYVLGLRPRFDLGSNVYDFNPNSGSLSQVSGDFPNASGGKIHVAWTRKGRQISYNISGPTAFRIRSGNQLSKPATEFVGSL